MKEFFNALFQGEFVDALSSFAPLVVKLVIVLLLAWIGSKLIKWVLSLLDKALNKSIEKGMDKGIAKFFKSSCKVLLYIVLFLIVVDQLGVPMTSFVTILGSVGLAVGLALQGSLSNFAGGVLILLTHPFRIGDYIVAGGQEGTVTDISICYTKLLTVDNRTVVFPNGTLSNSNLVNVTAEPFRRIDLEIPVSYDDDIREVRSMLLELCDRDARILNDGTNVNGTVSPTESPAPKFVREVYVKDFGDSSITILYRFWVRREDYWGAYFDMMESVRYAMKERGFTIPFNQLDVSIKNDKRN